MGELRVPDESRGIAEDFLDEAAWKSRAELRYSPEDNAERAARAIATPAIVAELQTLAVKLDRCAMYSAASLTRQRAADIEVESKLVSRDADRGAGPAVGEGR